MENLITLKIRLFLFALAIISVHLIKSIGADGCQFFFENIYFRAYCDQVPLEKLNMKWFTLNNNATSLFFIKTLSVQSQTKSLSLSSELQLNSFYFNEKFELYLTGFKSIELDFELHYIWDSYNFGDLWLLYYFQYSNFRIEYRNRKNLPCELSILRNLTENALAPKLRGDFHLFTGVKYEENTCSVILSRADLDYLKINGLVESLIERNILGFDNLTEEGKEIELDHRIHGFQLRNVYRVRLSTRLFSFQVFNTKSLVKSVLIDGIVSEVEPELFRFVRANEYSLNIINLRDFLVNNPKWIKNMSINKREPKIYIKQEHNGNNGNDIGLASALEKSNKYEFDDEDFCAFRYYPVKNQRIQLIVTGLNISRTTCPLQFLLRKECEVGSPIDAENKSICCNTTEMLERCDIQDITQTSSRVDKFTSIYDHIFSLELAKFIFAILLHPVACLLGFLFNCLSAWVIKQMNKDGGRGKHQGQKNAADRQEKLFGYFFFNALFSAGFCLVSVPELLTRCVRFNGIYCSPFIATDWVRVYYLAGIVLVGNVCKLGANLTQCSFTLYRFFINTDDGKSKWRSKFLKARPRNVASVFLIIAIVITLPQMFFNEGYTIKSVTGMKGFDMFLYDHHNQKYFESSPALIAIYVLNLVFNEVLSTCFNLVVDLKLLSFVRAVARNQKSLASAHKNKEKEEVEKRLSKMIIFNGILSILFKTPQMVVSLIKTSEFLINLLQQGNIQMSWCMFAYAYFDSICLNSLSIAQSFSSIYFLVNFFLFYFLNMPFQMQVKKLIAF
nr:G protein-coupled receptor [Proales similis]